MVLYKIKQGCNEVNFTCYDSIVDKDYFKKNKPTYTIKYTYDFEDFSIESDFPIDFDSEFVLLKKSIQKKDSMFNNKDSIDFLKNMFNMK